jgi:hypothetical protein
MAIGCIVVTSYDNRIIAEDAAGTLYNLELCLLALGRRKLFMKETN